MRKRIWPPLCVAGLLFGFTSTAWAGSMKLLAPDVGWALGTSRLLWWTTDGVHDWEDITPRIPKDGMIGDVFFLDTRRGWVLLKHGEPDVPGGTQTATGSDTVNLTGSTSGCPVGDLWGPSPPRANPRGFSANEETVVTVTTQVPFDPSLTSGSVTLFQVDANGNQIADLGPMFDDGTHGDAHANDGEYTTQVTFNPASAGPIYLAVRASYSASRGCRQSKNNDRPIAASGPRTTPAQMQAKDAVESAAGAYYDGLVAPGGQDEGNFAQAHQDLINFVLSNYGPNGTVNPGLVVSAGLGLDGNSVWWTYNDGLEAGLGDAVPGVGGSGSSNNKKSVAGKSNAGQPAPVQGDRAKPPNHEAAPARNEQASSRSPVSPKEPQSQAPADNLPGISSEPSRESTGGNP